MGASPAPSRQPLRLVSTKGMGREDWLRVRKNGIGSSDAAAAVGLNPYQSMLELWLIKTGRDAELPQIDPTDDSHPTYWGTLLEPFVAEYYTRHTGRRVRRVNAVLQHPEHAWMLANIDREVVGAPDVQILECKTSGGFGVRLWRDGVPEYVQVQVQHQLGVTGRQAADVCVVLGGQEARIHRIERDDELIAHLIELERRFWHYVETDTPPPADGSESAAQALQALYPRDRGLSIDLSVEPAMTEAFTRLVALRAELADLEKQEALLKQTLQQRMAYLPLELRLRGKSTTQSHRAPIYYVDLTLREGVTLVDAVTQAKQLEALQQQAGICQDALDAAARVGFGNGFSEESVEDAPALVEEFFTEDADAHAEEAGGPTPTGGLKGKLGQKANGQAAPVAGAT